MNWVGAQIRSRYWDGSQWVVAVWLTSDLEGAAFERRYTSPTLDDQTLLQMITTGMAEADSIMASDTSTVLQGTQVVVDGVVPPDAATMLAALPVEAVLAPVDERTAQSASLAQLAQPVQSLRSQQVRS